MPRFVVLCFLVLFAVACAASDPASGKGAAPGGPAPDFALKSLDGQTVSLHDYKGKVVLINFWATWCPPCKAEIPALEAAYRANKDKGFVVLGIDIAESQQVVAPFVAGMGMTYPVLLDEQDKLMALYRGLGLPMSILVDRDGIIRERHIGELSEAELSSYLKKLLPVQ